MSEAEGRKDSMIVDLFRHHSWANTRLLEACENLSDDHLNASVPGTYGTVRDTLWHLVRGEVSYVRRATGHQPEGERPKAGEFPGFERMKHDAQWCATELTEIALGAAVEDNVTEQEEKKYVRYPLTALLTQAINHATEHRAQIATILTQQGIEPPDMSGWAYMEATGLLHEGTEG